MRIKLPIIFLWVLTISKTTMAASYVFDYNARCHEAYQKYMALHLEQGTAAIRQEIAANPLNLMALYIADYDDCLRLLFNGNAGDYKSLYKNGEERLKAMDLGDKNSPWYRLCKAGLNFHWALVNVRFGDNFKAALAFRRSFILLKENKRLFPGFPQNKVFLGVEEAMVGTIPDDYKWLASVFGMKGNVRKGIAQIVSFINNSDEKSPLRNEAIIYYCYLKFYLLSQQDEVWKYVNSKSFNIENNLLHSFLKANLALNYRKADAALETMRYAQSLKGYRDFPILDYELGSALFLKLDAGALVHLQRFISNYNSTLFVKDAWQKMACLHYLQDNPLKANYCRAQIRKVGTAQVDADKQAERFSQSSFWPSLPVLQARLLIDGGYYIEAHNKLQKLKPSDLPSATDRLEYYFRLGRIYDELGNDPKALELYQSSINLGRTRQEHYAARSALQMGMIYERSGKIAEAVKKYNECLSMRHHDFQANIDQQAKAGINRLMQ